MNKLIRILAYLPILATVPVPVQVAGKEYTLTASAEKKEEQIIVSGKTNLPEGCVLGVFIERPHWERGDDTTYTGHMAFGEATVENGGYKISLTPDDRGWYDNAIMLIELGLWTDFERISDDVIISVVFTPKRDQPDSVYAIVGNNAENLTGEQVEFSGHFNVLKAETTLNVHFIPTSAKILMPVVEGEATIESVEIAKAVVRNWGAQAERYDVPDGVAVTVHTKDQNEEPINVDAELIVELYERVGAFDLCESWETAIGKLLDRWEVTISQNRTMGTTGEYNFELEYTGSIPYGVEYGILQVTLIRPDGKMFHAVYDMLSLTEVEYTHL